MQNTIVVIAFLLSSAPSVWGNLKRIDTASKGIAQIIYKFNEMFSIRSRIVIVGDHSHLMKIAGKVLSISNSSLIIQTMPVCNKRYNFLNVKESVIHKVRDSYTIGGKRKDDKATFYQNDVLIDFYYPRNLGKDVMYPEGYEMPHNRYVIYHHSDDELVVENC